MKEKLKAITMGLTYIKKKENEKLQKQDFVFLRRKKE